jgi:hypothetical protein
MRGSGIAQTPFFDFVTVVYWHIFGSPVNAFY